MSRSWTYRALSSLAFAAFSTAAFALPTNLYFDNQTDITLDAYTAGQPGASIQANSSNFSVPYIGVMIRCNNGGVPRACPIDFYDKAAGKKAASVVLDIKTATIAAPPVFYEDYGSKFMITGWDGSPLDRISIQMR